MESFDAIEVEFYANSVNGAVTDVENLLLLTKCSAHYADAQTWIYTCLEGEVCCPTGCCVRDHASTSRFWYAWFMITIFVALLAGCFHYYKKQQLRELRARELACRRAGARRAHGPLGERMRPTHPDDLPVEGSYIHFLRQYLLDTPLAAHRERLVAPPPPPPSYEVLMRTKEEEPPPVYVEACKLMAQREDAAGAQPAGHAQRAQAGDSCIIDALGCHD